MLLGVDFVPRGAPPGRVTTEVPAKPSVPARETSSRSSPALQASAIDPARLTDEEDWPPVNDTSEAAWKNTKQLLVENHSQLLTAIANVDESRLNEPIIKDPNTPYSSVYVTLHGGVQHDLYHAGQIAMLKKALVNL